MKLSIKDLGRREYSEALAMQRDLVEKRRTEQIQDTLIFVEHPPVITMGRRASSQDLRVTEKFLASQDVPVHHIERGGEATYHGPGQLVGYTIINLYNHERKLKEFIWKLEEVFIRFLYDKFSIEAERIKNLHGVWIGNEKIAAIGIAITNKITMHGFALNVNTDLSHFQWIVPCGIQDKGVTSLRKITGRTDLDMEVIKEDIKVYFVKIFGYKGSEIDA
jgi:lipoyl(octanoyl) transferase